MTAKLYRKDSYTTQFEAQVTKVMPLEKGFGIVLDKTYFYPEGGGQPSDRGTLNQLPVLDVSESKNGELIHLVESELSGSVFGQVNWATRFDTMQQHTGQHILSQAALRIANAPTVSWSLNRNKVSITIACATLSQDEIVAMEEVTNQIIYENLSVKVYEVKEPQLLRGLPLRKQPLPEHFFEGVRIVEVDQFDVIPCGGTHCAKTGEVGSILVKSWRKRGHEWQITFQCGKRALADYQAKRATLYTLQQAFKVPEHKVQSKVLELMSELDERNRSLAGLQKELLTYEAQAIAKGASLIGDGSLSLALKIIEDGDARRLKPLASTLGAQPNMIVLLGYQGYQDTTFRLTIARSDNVTLDANRTIKQLCQEFGGRGGGKPGLAQAGGFNADRVPAIMQRAKEIIEAATEK